MSSTKNKLSKIHVGEQKSYLYRSRTIFSYYWWNVFASIFPQLYNVRKIPAIRKKSLFGVLDEHAVFDGIHWFFLLFYFLQYQLSLHHSPPYKCLICCLYKQQMSESCMFRTCTRNFSLFPTSLVKSCRKMGGGGFTPFNSPHPHPKKCGSATKKKKRQLLLRTVQFANYSLTLALFLRTFDIYSYA